MALSRSTIRFISKPRPEGRNESVNDAAKLRGHKLVPRRASSRGAPHKSGRLCRLLLLALALAVAFARVSFVVVATVGAPVSEIARVHLGGFPPRHHPEDSSPPLLLLGCLLLALQHLAPALVACPPMSVLPALVLALDLALAAVFLRLELLAQQRAHWLVLAAQAVLALELAVAALVALVATVGADTVVSAGVAAVLAPMALARRWPPAHALPVVQVATAR